MSLDTTLASSINTFPVSPFVTVPAALLQSLQDSLQALQDEVAALHEQRDQDRQELASLRATVTALETRQEEDTNRLCLDICQDRQRLARLEKVEPQPLQKDRGDILRALLAANGGKMLAKDARKKMRLDEATFSRLLDSTEEHIEKRAYHLDKRQSILIIK